MKFPRDPFAPSPSEQLGQVLYQVAVSPRRPGYLVRQDDPDDVRRALVAGGALWGGAGGPLLPVTAEGVAVDLVRFDAAASALDLEPTDAASQELVDAVREALAPLWRLDPAGAEAVAAVAAVLDRLPNRG